MKFGGKILFELAPKLLYRDGDGNQNMKSIFNMGIDLIAVRFNKNEKVVYDGIVNALDI